jgi:hypothetical protein
MTAAPTTMSPAVHCGPRVVLDVSWDTYERLLVDRL